MIKNIIISAGASRTSGAKTIYLQLIEHLRYHVGNHRYIVFVDKSMPRPEIAGVEYVIVDVRKGLDRLRFDYNNCKKILDNLNVEPDLIVSLQNTGVACLKDTWQIVYYHQPLPFYPQRWSPLKKAERRLFMYKYIYPWFVRNSIRKDRVDFIAQIPFIKDAIINLLGIDAKRVHVLFPDTEKIEPENLKLYAFESNTVNFIYPATAVSYKNHKLLVDALSFLRENNNDICNKLRIHLTVSSEDSPQLVQLIKEAGLKQQFVLHGAISHDRLLCMLNDSHGLLFPSTIETLGLPLLEAAKLGKAIVASNLTYAHQVVGEYEGVDYVDVKDAKKWAEKIEELSKMTPRKYRGLMTPEESSWEEFFALIECRVGGGQNQALGNNSFGLIVDRSAALKERRVAA